jgi:hypothetical protein
MNHYNVATIRLNQTNGIRGNVLLVKDQTNVDMCFNLKCLLVIRIMNWVSKKIAVLWDVMPLSVVDPVSTYPAASVFKVE